MQSLSVLPFSPAESPTQFTAVGYLFGRFEPLPDQSPEGGVKGTLHLKGGIGVDAMIVKWLWEKIAQDPSIDIEKAYLWRVYPRTAREGNLKRVQLMKCIPVEGKTTLRHSPPVESGADWFSVRGYIVYVSDERVVLQIERNLSPPEAKAKNYIWQPFLLTVFGDISQEAKVGQFWEIFCLRTQECLKIEQAHPIADNIAPPSKGGRNAAHRAHTQVKSQSEPLPHPAIMITGRQPEITVKFNERPDLPEQGKKVTLQVTGENGVVVKAQLNRQTLKKQVAKMDGFADWVAALSGKVANVSSGGIIELESASVSVFEKKQKIPPQQEALGESSPDEAVVKPLLESPNPDEPTAIELESASVSVFEKEQKSSPQNEAPAEPSPDEVVVEPSRESRNPDERKVKVFRLVK